MGQPSKPLVPVPFRTGTKGVICTGSGARSFFTGSLGAFVPVGVRNRYERFSAKISDGGWGQGWTFGTGSCGEPVLKGASILSLSPPPTRFILHFFLSLSHF